MSSSPEQTPRTDVSDIEIDSNGRRVLDTPDKIVRWIKYQHEEQETKNPDFFEFANDHFIDLSNCIIRLTTGPKGGYTPMHISDLAGKIDCIVDTSHQKNNKKTKFSCEVLETIECNNSIIYGCSFDWTKFHKHVSFNNTKIYAHSYWEFCEFMGFFILDKCEVHIDSFSNSVFHENFIFFNSQFTNSDINIWNCIFEKEVLFSNNSFRKTQKKNSFINFSSSSFKNGLKMSNIIFKSGCYFNYCHFGQDVKLTNIRSDHTISFYGSSFAHNLLLTSNSDIEIPTRNHIREFNLSHVNIIRADIENSNILHLLANSMTIQNDGIFKSLNNVITDCDMASICNRGMLFFEDSTISSIKLADAMNLGIVELENTHIDGRNIADRKTARILKDSASKSNNAIDALKYKYLELELYRREGGISIADRIILVAQKLSNRYGTNFVQGIAFTMLAAMAFFWAINYIGVDQQMFYLNARFDFSGFGEIWKKYLDVLNVLNFRDKLDGVGLNAWGETLFLAAKIFIAYGMYQTVSAFRKYSKNHL